MKGWQGQEAQKLCIAVGVGHSVHARQSIYTRTTKNVY